MHRIFGLAGAAVTAAFGSAVCCAGPTVAAAIGVSAAGLSNLTPYRPLFILAAVGALWVGWDRLDREDQACDEGKPCAAPAELQRMKLVLGAAFVLALPAITATVEDPGMRTGDVGSMEAMQDAKQPKWMLVLNPFLGAVGCLLGGRLKKTEG